MDPAQRAVLYGASSSVLPKGGQSELCQREEIRVYQGERSTTGGGGADMRAFQEGVAAILLRECDVATLHTFIDGKSALGQTLWRQAAELGWLGASLPESLGGLGLGAAWLRALNYELGRHAAPGPYVATLGFIQWLCEIGIAGEFRGDIDQIVAGSATASVPAAFGAGDMIVREGGLYGSMLMLGDAEAGLLAVPAISGDRAVWAILRPGEGVRLDPQESWDRTRRLCRLSCDGADAAHILDDPVGTIGARLRRLLAFALAADSLGGAQRIMAITVDYLKTREQFGRAVGSFQAIKHRVASLMGAIATQDHLLDQALDSLSTNAHSAAMWVALAKAGATECFDLATSEAILLHGGVGHTWEYAPHIYAKRARLNEALVGDRREQRDLAARLLAAETRSGRPTTEIDVDH